MRNLGRKKRYELQAADSKSKPPTTMPNTETHDPEPANPPLMKPRPKTRRRPTRNQKAIDCTAQSDTCGVSPTATLVPGQAPFAGKLDFPIADVPELLMIGILSQSSNANKW